jgi:predicted RNase H-like nuclease (RuvC/YqgF family)
MVNVDPMPLLDEPIATRLAHLTACVEEHQQALAVLQQHVQQRKAQIRALKREIVRLRREAKEGAA